jgi:radical SAM superfamily enzyme
MTYVVGNPGKGQVQICDRVNPVDKPDIYDVNRIATLYVIKLTYMLKQYEMKILCVAS